MTFGLYLMTAKGLHVLDGLLAENFAGQISYVIGAKDPNAAEDYFGSIADRCREHAIPHFENIRPAGVGADYSFAISWRRLIQDISNLIVLHDSLLPRYRGFAPLPTALIKGEEVIGVTALLASEEYDRGDIIGQRSITVSYPLKIQAAIEQIADLYAELVIHLCRVLAGGGRLEPREQNEEQATYSLWRDEEDYHIDWSNDAAFIKRFIDSLGYPYKGAFSIMNGRKIRLYDAEVEPDVHIENRQPGKIIFLRSGAPVVVCGTGLLRITTMSDDETRTSLLPCKKLRLRFT